MWQRERADVTAVGPRRGDIILGYPGGPDGGKEERRRQEDWRQRKRGDGGSRELEREKEGKREIERKRGRCHAVGFED